MKKSFLGIISLISLLLILSACTDKSGKAVALSNSKSKTINANSCNADELCEMNSASLIKGIYSPDTLYLVPNNGQVIVGGPYPPTSLILANGITISGKTISTVPGSTANLILTSDNKEVEVDGGLVVNDGLSVTKNAYFGGNVVVVGQLSLDNKVLPDASNYPYYVCADPKGNLVMSKKPCGQR